MPRGIKGLRWIETGRKVWQLEDTPRHFCGCVSVYGDGYAKWFVGSFAQGEAKSEKEGKTEVEKVIIPIHRYCQGTTFGKHPYAVFEFENGKPVVRAVGSADHCQRYMKEGRLIVNVKEFNSL